VNSAYRVVLANLSHDREEIIGVWARNFNVYTHDEHRQRLTWNYEHGPFGAGRCWLLLHHDSVVGTAGLGFRHLYVAGKPVAVGVASDLAVDPPHRCLQPALLMQKAVLNTVGAEVRAIYGTPNHKSEALFRHIRYSRVGTVTRWVKVLRTVPFARSADAVPSRLATGKPAPVDGLVFVAASRDTWRSFKRTAIREITSFDSRFDELWLRTAAAHGAVSCRSAAFLRWRYSRYPLRKYSTVALVNSTEDVVLGYCVLYTCGQGEMAIADFWADPEFPQSADGLMAGVIQWCRRRHAASLTVTFRDSEPMREVVQAFGFVSRHPQGNVMARGCTDADVKALEPWCFMPGDEDYN